MMNTMLCAPDAVGAIATEVLAEEQQAFFSARDVSEALSDAAVIYPSVILVGGASTQAVVRSCRELRASPACRNAVIVAVSKQPEDAAALVDAGADDFVAESVTKELLRGRLSLARRTADRRAAERDLAESLATTLDCIGDGVIATDQSGAVIRMSPVAEQLTGWTFADAQGQPLHDVFPIVNDATDTHTAPAHALLTRRDGSEIPIADSCAAVKSADGMVNGAVVVFRDLTAERTLAHEINNPLSYITANVDMALEQVRALRGGSTLGQIEEVEAMLREARDGAARVMNIVRELDSHARTSMLAKDSDIDLIDVIEVGIRRASSHIQHRAHVVRDYGRVPLIAADDGRLGRVFNNILVNACQAFAADDVTKNEIRISTSTDTRGRAVVAIWDNGPGIPPEFLTRVFDPFFTTKPVGVGTGLGLAASRNTVVALGGQVAVESEVGTGTTVRVTLPAIASDEPRRIEARVDPARPTAVLVIDDERAIGTAIRRVLHDHDVTVVTTGQAALALLEGGNTFDLVLCDLMMPAMSGMELYDALLLRHPTIAPKVVFLTGGAFTPEADAFLRRVGNRRLKKPFDSDELRALARLHGAHQAN
jgi:PAS domain S-box-containing protein